MEKDSKTIITVEECISNMGKIFLNKLNEVKPEWKNLEDDPINEDMQKNMGIGFLHPAYIEVNETQDILTEYNKIKSFLNKYIKYYSISNNIPIEDLNLNFINYGKTELVYVLSEKDGKRITLLVKQPAVRFGEVKEEMENLLVLKLKDKNIVAPIDYFTLDDQELYVTPYINQARCIASYTSRGMYIPEPFYRFESFTKEQESVVNTSMIAKLVSLYDHEKQEGICSCKIGGGDFMLPKGWENKFPTIENTLNNLYLIAARKKINCSYLEYLKILRSEFSRTTISEPQEDIIINLRGRVPMDINNIEAGIKLGEELNVEEQKIKLRYK